MGGFTEKPHRFIGSNDNCNTNNNSSKLKPIWCGVTTLTHLVPFVRDSYLRYVKKYEERGFSKRRRWKYAKKIYKKK